MPLQNAMLLPTKRMLLQKCGTDFGTVMKHCTAITYILQSLNLGCSIATSKIVIWLHIEIACNDKSQPARLKPLNLRFSSNPKKQIELGGICPPNHLKAVMSSLERNIPCFK